MRAIKFILVLLFALSSAANAECVIDYNKDSEVLKVNGCPKDVEKLIDDESSCIHFAGEITGNPATGRDKEVYNQLEELGCETDGSYCNRQKILNKYKGDSTIYNKIVSSLKIIYGDTGYKETMEEMEKTKCQKY